VLVVWAMGLFWLSTARRRLTSRLQDGLEGIVSKRVGSRYRSGRSKDWLKFKNPEAPAVKREAEEDWGRRRWR
jgi:ATP-dependent DNA ligase